MSNIELKPCPFCGGKGRISFKWEGQGSVKTGRKIKSEFGFDFIERVPATRYRVTIICNRCKSRGKPVFTKLLTKSPYGTSYSGRCHSCASEIVEASDNEYREYVEMAAENWNRRTE